MDTPSRARPTSVQLAAGSESPAGNATSKQPARRLSTDATSSLSLEGSTSSSGSVGIAATAACSSGPSDTAAAAAAATASPHHESEFVLRLLLYILPNKNLTIANRSRVICAHDMPVPQ